MPNLSTNEAGNAGISINVGIDAPSDSGAKLSDAVRKEIVRVIREEMARGGSFAHSMGRR